MKRVGLMGAVVLALAIATAAAAASSGWEVQRSPNPSGATSSVLNGVSCATESACTAVGQYNNGSRYLTLGERWNGTRWSLRHAPSPGSVSNNLVAVRCSSANRCMAVGSSQDGSTTETLAERWNGKKWSIVHTPNPTGSPASYLNAITCTSTKACTAVGSSQSGSTVGTLAERWNGKRWAIETTPNPAGATSSSLSGVSCASRGACTAVGSSQASGSPAVTLAERWNAKKWSIQQTRNPSGATSSQLNSVSCTAAGGCTAVGSYEKTANAERTLAERWNGKKWSIQTTLNPTSDPNKFLLAVSCSSAKACTAAGFASPPLVWKEKTIVERWNGSKWSVQHGADRGTDSVLSGLSCVASTCTAVGWYENNSSPNKTLVERRQRS